MTNEKMADLANEAANEALRHIQAVAYASWIFKISGLIVAVEGVQA